MENLWLRNVDYVETETMQTFQVKGKTSVQLEISYFILNQKQINKYYWKTIAFFIYIRQLQHAMTTSVN